MMKGVGGIGAGLILIYLLGKFAIILVRQDQERERNSPRAQEYRLQQQEKQRNQVEKFLKELEGEFNGVSDEGRSNSDEIVERDATTLDKKASKRDLADEYVQALIKSGVSREEAEQIVYGPINQKLEKAGKSEE